MVAKEWGLTPSQFQRLSTQDKAEMIATELVVNKMAAWEHQIYNPKKGK